MAVYRAQIGFAMDSALPRDIVTINPHYNGDNAQALADALKANLIANVNVAQAVPFTIKIYDAAKAPPSFPLAQAANGTGFVATTAPRELALALSYYATWNRPSYRGRIFLPLRLIASTGGSLRPTAGERTTAGAWINTLGKTLPSNTFMVVYSRKFGTGAQVNNWWVDDEWDVIRSRGLRATTRTAGTLP